MKLIFCGDRYWTDKSIIRDVMIVLRRELGDFTVIEGENGEVDIYDRPFRGADLLSRAAAEEIGLTVDPTPADWKNYGRAAGPIRNKFMLINKMADGVVAFHNDLTKSKGTANMVKQAREAKRPVWIYKDGITATFVEFITELRSRNESLP